MVRESRYIRWYNVQGLTKSGFYSHVVQAGELLFVSGMLPVDYERGLKITDEIDKATELVLNNIKKALEATGSSLDKVVKVTVFLRDISDFSRMNEVYGKFFPNNPPARTCVAVKDIPGDFPLEMEVIATK